MAFFLLADNGGKSSNLLWKDAVVGDTTSSKGVHQVIIALLAVMDWAETI